MRQIWQERENQTHPKKASKIPREERRDRDIITPAKES
jgi:hypothetical protein